MDNKISPTFSVRLGGKASIPNRKAMIEHYKDFTIIETIAGIGWDIKERLKSNKIIGTDISKEMLDAKTEKIARILCDGAHLCFKDAMFDAVVYIASLEFLDD